MSARFDLDPARPATADELRERVARLEAERETLVEMVTHLQRVAQTGLVTSALAHDVVNHAGGISGVAYLARRQPNPERWETALDRIQAQCCEFAETTNTFLEFVRRRELAGPRSFRAPDILEKVRRLVLPLASPRGRARDPGGRGRRDPRKRAPRDPGAGQPRHERQIELPTLPPA